jgi:hypothetical protein
LTIRILDNVDPSEHAGNSYIRKTINCISKEQIVLIEFLPKEQMEAFQTRGAPLKAKEQV